MEENSYVSGSENAIQHLFAKDPTESHDFWENYKRKTALEPEKVLMLAVLEGAFWCLKKYADCKDYKRKKRFNDEIEWFSSDDESYIFSFVSVCENLGLNPEYIRKPILERFKKAA